MSRLAFLGFILLAATQPAAPTASQAGPAERQLWVANYDGPKHKNDLPVAIGVSPDSATVFVTGSSYYGPVNPDCSNYATIAYDAGTGEAIWESRYDSVGRSCDNPVGLAVSEDGALVFVTGTGRPGRPEDIITVAYDAADGHEVWVAAQDGPINGYEVATGIVTDEDIVYVAGALHVDDSDDIWRYTSVLIAYDAATGSRLWDTEYAVDGGSTLPRDLTVADTGIYVTGVVVGGDVNAGELSIVAYDGDTGLQRWAARARGNFDDGTSIAASSDGAIVIVGAWNPTGRRHRMLAYSADSGSQLWMTLTGRNEFSDSIDVVASPTSDTVFLSANGATHAGGTYSDHFLIVALNAISGTIEWRARYVNPRGHYDNPDSMAIAADGSQLFITGGTQERGFHESIATVAYDAATGTRQWVGIYGRKLGGDHFASSVATSPDGNGVYVAGRSETSTGWSDFTTVKYESA